MPRQPKYTLEGVSRKLLKTVHSIADELQQNAKIKKETIEFMGQLNELIDKILLLQGKPTIIKKDIKEIIKEDKDKPIDVNTVLDTFKDMNDSKK